MSCTLCATLEFAEIRDRQWTLLRLFVASIRRALACEHDLPRPSSGMLSAEVLLPSPAVCFGGTTDNSSMAFPLTTCPALSCISSIEASTVALPGSSPFAALNFTCTSVITKTAVGSFVIAGSALNDSSYTINPGGSISAGPSDTCLAGVAHHLDVWHDFLTRYQHVPF